MLVCSRIVRLYEQDADTDSIGEYVTGAWLKAGVDKADNLMGCAAYLREVILELNTRPESGRPAGCSPLYIVLSLMRHHASEGYQANEADAQ